MYDKIKIVCMDIDGTLTDGIYQISESGEVTKSFYTRDFYAIEQLLRSGLTVIIITQSHDNVMDKQIKRICSHSDFWKKMIDMGNLLLWNAINNKAHAIGEFRLLKSWEWDNIAYIGDAENDIECIRNAVFSGCPADAIMEVRENALYSSNYNGGHGAVYDFCMHILEQRKQK